MLKIFHISFVIVGIIFGNSVSFTPGFSQVIQTEQEIQKPFKRFPVYLVTLGHLAEARCE